MLPNVLGDWGNGVRIQKFKPEWREPIKILQSYVTCEGRYAFVFKYHFMFLQHLNHEAKMNLPFFLPKESAKDVKQSKRASRSYSIVHISSWCDKFNHKYNAPKEGKDLGLFSIMVWVSI